MERTITLTSTVSQLHTVLDALIGASIEAEGDAWLASVKAKQNPEDTFYATGVKVAQAHNEALHTALDYLWTIVWSARDKNGNFVHVTEEANRLQEDIA